MLGYEAVPTQLLLHTPPEGVGSSRLAVDNEGFPGDISSLSPSRFPQSGKLKFTPVSSQNLPINCVGKSAGKRPSAVRRARFNTWEENVRCHIQ
jgi:hypothetical protein